jgi:hypothetical protein
MPVRVVTDEVGRQRLMWPWMENPPVMLWHGHKDAVEETEQQSQGDKKQAGGDPPGDKAKPARDTEVGVEEGEHQAAAATAAARMSRASANCATLPEAPEPPPKRVCVMVGTIVMLRMKAMNTAMTP